LKGGVFVKIIFCLFVVLFLIALFYKKRVGVFCIYKKRVSLLTNAERSFYGVLLSVVPVNDYDIFCKVRLLDIVYPDRKGYAHLNRVKSKHIDFLLCRKNDLSPALAIELDDFSHIGRESRDCFKDEVMKLAGVPLVRFKVRAAYNLVAVSAEIMKNLQV